MEINLTGKIKLIRLENFMTYEFIKFAPNAEMNVILGPNGTGKSTLVSAILIGMGGDFKKIGRATSLKDYIKSNQQKAAIEITLFKNEHQDEVKFRREFDRKNRYRWLINGKEVSESKYMDMVRYFNIQVDNLCQFLPQDRVQDFALMNPHQILVNTQNSVCPTSICTKFDKLLELEQFSKNANDESDKLNGQIASEEAQNEQLKSVVDRMKQRNVITERLKVAFMKQKWVELKEIKEREKDMINDFRIAKSRLEERKIAFIPIKRESEDILKEKEIITQKINSIKVDFQRTTRELKGFETAGQEEEEKVNEAVRNHRNQLQDVEDRKQEELKLKQDLQTVLNQMKEMKKEYEESGKVNKQELDGKLRQLKSQRDELMTSRSEITFKLDSNLKPQIVQRQNKINSLKSMQEQRIENLKSQDENLYDAVQWLKNNRNLFKGNVYDPMILELNIKKPSYIKYIENCISLNDLKAFTCERTSDSVLLVEKLNQLKLRVNVVHSEAASEVKYQPNVPIKSVQHLGLHSYLLDWIDAPIPILNFLCRMYSVHNIPIGDEKAYQNLSKIQSQTQFRLLFILDSRIQVLKSMYTSETTRMNSTISGRNLIAAAVDETIIEKFKVELQSLIKSSDELRNKLTEIDGKIAYFDGKTKELQDVHKKLLERQAKIRSKETQLRNLTEKLTRIKATVYDPQQSEAALQNALKQFGTRLLDIEKKKLAKLETYMTQEHEIQLLKRSQQFKNSLIGELNARLQEATTALEGAKTTLDRITAARRDAIEELKSIKNQLDSLTNNHSPESRDFPFKDIFNQLPDELEEIKGQITILQTKVDCMDKADESLFMEYEQRKKDILELKATLAAHQAKKSTSDEEINRLYQTWLPEITKIVSVINTNFARFMASIQAVGEVILIENDEKLFSNFGIGIRVKYRDDAPFLILDRYHHSGGERAVAIATYTLALQQISQVPFRCVDEINQGMDPDNERKVFDMLVEEAAKPGMAQYFFVSPKFQPDVKTNQYTSFHIIDSGKFLPNSEVFDMSISQ